RNDAMLAVLERGNAVFKQAGGGRARYAIAVAVRLAMLAGREIVQRIEYHRGPAPHGGRQAGVRAAGGGRSVGREGHGHKRCRHLLRWRSVGRAYYYFNIKDYLNNK